MALQNDNRREKLRLLEGLAIGGKEIGAQEKAASAPAVRRPRGSAVLALSGVIVLSVGGAMAWNWWPDDNLPRLERTQASGAPETAAQSTRPTGAVEASPCPQAISTLRASWSLEGKPQYPPTSPDA